MQLRTRDQNRRTRDETGTFYSGFMLLHVYKRQNESGAQTFWIPDESRLVPFFVSVTTICLNKGKEMNLKSGT